jgi:hypothetical protein
MSMHDEFIRSIHEMRFVLITADSYEKGIIQRICVPFDYGPSSRARDGQNRYHFWDLNSPEGPHNLSILPSQLQGLEILEERFNPEDYVHWQTNWHIPRNWGRYS